MANIVSGLLSFLLTIAILSYLIGDNPIYRVAVHLFVGVAAGYAVVVAYYAVIQPQLVAPLPAALEKAEFLDAGGLVLALALGLLLLFKSLGVAHRLGSLVVAFLVGVGAAVAVGGAVIGTLIPQTDATILSLAPPGSANTLSQQAEYVITAAAIIVGTLTSLGFFYYGGRAEPGAPVERPALVRPIAAIGQVFIGTAFGVMYAGALAASLAVFAERSAAIKNLVQLLMTSP